MNKKVVLGKEGRDKLMKGVETVSNAVVSTLGPLGRNIVFINQDEIVHTTKDGVTVAKEIELEDPIENMGAKMVKQASISTGDKAGDGTTTSMLLAKEMIFEGALNLNNNENSTEIRRDMDKAVKEVVEELKNTLKIDIQNKNQIKNIAIISSNNDEDLGGIISDALEDVGLDGFVHLEESKTGETYLENVEGLQFKRGYESPYFVTNNDTMTSVLKEPLILIADSQLGSIKALLPILEYASGESKPLLIISQGTGGEVLSTLLVNKARGILSCCSVKAPDFGDRRKLVLEDIAILTGGEVFDPEKGMKLDAFSPDWFGKSRLVTITKDTTNIIDGSGEDEALQKHANNLKSQIDKSTSPYETEKLQERLSNLVSGVSIIYIGGVNETDYLEKKDRADDALNATQAAIAEGILPGGGIALLRARKVISKQSKTSIGYRIVYNACKKPFEQILKNAGLNEEEILNLSLKISKSDKNLWNGYNVRSEKIEDFKELGVIDPFKVTRTALENAANVAGNFLLTEGVIFKVKEKKEDNNHFNMGM